MIIIYNLKAVIICNEFNMREIAKHEGIDKKIKWEEPLILTISEDKIVYLYHFGAMVFVNFTDLEIEGFKSKIRSIPNAIKSKEDYMNYNCSESYTVEMGDSISIENNKATIATLKNLDMVTFVLAQSVALENIEISVNKMMDDVEVLINGLKAGQVKFKQKRSAKLIGNILAFKHTVISYIMLLDKPTITWESTRAEGIFNEMAELFELNDRFEIVNVKTESLLKIVEIITNLSDSQHSTKLELIVILLILIEVIFAFPEYLQKIFHLF